MGTHHFPTFLVFCMVLLWAGGKDSSHTLPVEICENARDDDGDGLIDLNDPDCTCTLIEPISRIPNPSFEDMNCCPSGITQLYCADTWIQASTPTTDYLNTCGWTGWNDLPPPLPFPDGKGAVGFRDGRNIQGQAEPWWKEYVGACLLAPLLAGVPYRIEFSIGFTYPANSPPINVHFFGTTDCENLPFGGGDERFGCPTNGPGWVKLGEVRVSGSNNWVKTRIDITPQQDIYAITIGPGCEDRPASVHYYYFIDNLILDEQSVFNYQISDNGENPCSNNFTLQIPAADSLNYQWYKNGVALLGETNPQLRVTTGGGQYQVRIAGADGCRVTNAYRHVIPVERYSANQILCEGETLLFGNQHIKREGIYLDTLKTAANCDSIVQLTVVEALNQQNFVNAKIFETEHYRIAQFRFSQPGVYPVHLTSKDGCDSLVTLRLEFYRVFFPSAFSPNGDGVNDYFNIMGGDDLVEIRSILVFDKWGNQVYADRELLPNQSSSGWDGNFQGKLSATGVYTYTAVLLMDDGKERRFSGSFTLVR
ncbi:MAG: gliding motility-associated C-terminal domain-containing protein [Saprospiraceae bacterium]|nr:gliding motility-associated C-terminal domain-containing protein [Lewinella sp.]